MRCRVTPRGRAGVPMAVRHTGRAGYGNEATPTASAAEEHPISRVRRLVGVVVAEPVQENPEFGAVARWDLHADEHAAVVVAVIAVVEQADVPAAAHPVEEAHQ